MYQSIANWQSFFVLYLPKQSKVLYLLWSVSHTIHQTFPSSAILFAGLNISVTSLQTAVLIGIRKLLKPAVIGVDVHRIIHTRVIVCVEWRYVFNQHKTSTACVSYTCVPNNCILLAFLLCHGMVDKVCNFFPGHGKSFLYYSVTLMCHQPLLVFNIMQYFKPICNNEFLIVKICEFYTNWWVYKVKENIL